MHVEDKLVYYCYFDTMSKLVPAFTGCIRGSSVWLDIANCHRVSFPLGRRALGVAGGKALLGLLRGADAAFFHSPVVSVFCIAPCVYLFPGISNSEILCFPPSLNFRMETGLESGTLLCFA